MNYKYLLSIAFLNVFISFNINSQDLSPIEEKPFIVERIGDSIKLPDSFNIKDGNGTLAIEIVINKKSEIKNFYIRKISLKNGKNKLFYIYVKNENKTAYGYPIYIRPFYPLIEGYIKQNFSVKPNPKYNNKPKEQQVSFLVHLL